MIDFTTHSDYWSYEPAYGVLDVRDKVVVDVGGDFGSSAYYFLQRGAKKVIMFESNPQLCELADSSFGGDSRVEIKGEWKGEAPEGDIFKMDCDGCEKMLTPEILNKYPVWIVAIHWPPYLDMEQFERLKKMLEDAGGKFHWQTPDLIENMWLKRPAP